MPSTLNEFLERALKDQNKNLNEKRKELKTHTVTITLVDFSTDKDEPAFDVETRIDGKPVMGGGSKQVFSTKNPNAKKQAEARIQEILKKIKKIGEE
jgi:hypothetical protein